MTGAQFDLFSRPAVPNNPVPATRRLAAKSPADYDDQSLLAALAGAGIAEGPALAREAGLRGLADAVPVLEAVCRRFAGFGRERPVPEQVAALEALAAIGGREAAGAVARLISRRAVQGPVLGVALAAASALAAKLEGPLLVSLLADRDPAIRAAACGCAGSMPEVATALVALLDDLHEGVRTAAACALGRLGRREARPLLQQLLRASPSPDVIDALASVADEDCLVLIGRVARARTDLAPAVFDALELADLPIAARIRASILVDEAAAPG